jgi:hypothetical protein
MARCQPASLFASQPRVIAHRGDPHARPCLLQRDYVASSFRVTGSAARPGLRRGLAALDAVIRGRERRSETEHQGLPRGARLRGAAGGAAPDTTVHDVSRGGG